MIIGIFTYLVSTCVVYPFSNKLYRQYVFLGVVVCLFPSLVLSCTIVVYIIVSFLHVYNYRCEK